MRLLPPRRWRRLFRGPWCSSCVSVRATSAASIAGKVRILLLQKSHEESDTSFPPFSPSLISLMASVDDKHHVYYLRTRAQESRWTSWDPFPNKPTISVDVKQHFNQVFRRVAVSWVRKGRGIQPRTQLSALMELCQKS